MILLLECLIRVEQRWSFDCGLPKVLLAMDDINRLVLVTMAQQAGGPPGSRLFTPSCRLETISYANRLQLYVNGM